MSHSRRTYSFLLIAALTILRAPASTADLRVAAWNISEFGNPAYNATRTAADVQTAVFGSFNGLSMSPDVIIAQEIWQQGEATFLNDLNTNPFNTGAHDWAAFFNPAHMGNDSFATNDLVLYYRTSRVTPKGNPVLVDTGSSSSSTAPRDTYRFDLKINGDAMGNQVLAVYGNHMKAGSDATSQARRQVTANAIRSNANSLGANYSFLFGSDTNIQSSTEQAYQTMVGSTSNNRGRFFDPIDSPGTWNNNAAFKYIHTQDPTGPGGMDDRFDQLLVSNDLTNSANSLHYVGRTNSPYSTTTWNDPNHSYRCWGNDGTSFNNSLTVTGNSMVGSTIAQALKNCATPDGGHLPVFMDLEYATALNPPLPILSDPPSPISPPPGAPAPEPASWAALGLGLFATMRRRRGKRP